MLCLAHQIGSHDLKISSITCEVQIIGWPATISMLNRPQNGAWPPRCIGCRAPLKGELCANQTNQRSWLRWPAAYFGGGDRHDRARNRTVSPAFNISAIGINRDRFLFSDKPWKTFGLKFLDRAPESGRKREVCGAKGDWHAVSGSSGNRLGVSHPTTGRNRGAVSLLGHR